MHLDIGLPSVRLEQFSIDKIKKRKIISFFFMGFDYSADIELFLPYTIVVERKGFDDWAEYINERLDYIINELSGRWHGYHSITVNGYLIHFELEEDAIMFRLRW